MVIAKVDDVVNSNKKETISWFTDTKRMISFSLYDLILATTFRK